MTIDNLGEDSKEQNETNNKKQTSSKKFEDLRWTGLINEFIDGENTYNLSEINDEFLNKKTDKFFSENSAKKEEFDKLEPEEQKKLKEAFSKSLESVYISKKEIISNLEKTFSDTYDLSIEQKKKLSEGLLKLRLNDSRQKSEKESDKTRIDLKELSMFKSFQEDFLVELGFFPNSAEIVFKKETDFDIGNIFGTDKIDFKSQTDKFKVLTLLREWKTTSRIDTDDLRTALKYIPAENKSKIFEYFISKISLKDLKEAGFLSEEKANEIKENLIKKYKESGENINIKGEDFDESLVFIGSNFIVNELVTSEKIESLLVREVAKEINKLKAETLDEDSKNFNESFNTRESETFTNEDFIKKIKAKALYGVSNIEKLQENNFMVYEVHTSIGVNRIIKRIDRVDVGGDNDDKGLELTDLSSFYGVLKTPKAESIKSTYQNFEELLSYPSYAKNNEETASINFYTKEEYDAYLKESDIKQVEKEEGVENLEDLKSKIDAIDPDGVNFDITKPGGTTFVIGKPGENEAYGHFSIRSINENSSPKTITLSSKDYKTGVYETLTFEQFLAAFEKKEAKRGVFLGARDPFLQEFFKMKAFDGKFEFKDGKLVEKVEKGDKARELEYLANSKGEAIKIEEFGADYVSICTGDLKEKKSKDGKSTQKSFELSYPTRINYEDFYNYINNVKSEKEDYQPVLEEKEEKIDDIKDANRKSSVGKKLMSFYCIADIVAGLKMLPNGVEEYLKQGSSIRSAKFALALGQYLPDDIRLQLQSKVESEQKKTVEGLVDKRITLDSTEFIPKIDKIIQNSSSEDYEVEAALMAILKKYGKLYRGDLAKHSGTFIWYRALGGKPNDALYRDIKAKYKKDGKPFTEEALIEELLKIQSTPLNDSKRKPYGITRKRRSKFGKDYGGYVKSGVKDELEDGKAKTEGMLSVDSVIGYALGEFTKLAHNNGLGAMDVVWEKGGSSKQMNMLPHIITSTGLAQSLWDSTLTSLFGKSFKKPYPALHFCKTQEDIQTYRNVCRKLVNKMQISSDDKALFAKSIDDSKSEQDRIKASAEFYEKHGEELMKKLNINQDPVIFLEKDKDPDFKKYYDKLHELYNDDKMEYAVDKGSLGAGVYDYDNSSLFMFGGDLGGGISMEKLGLGINEQTFNVNNDGRIILAQFGKAYKDIANLNISEEEKKKIFKYYYTTIENSVHKKYGDKFKRAMDSNSISAVHTSLKSDLGINMYMNARDKNYYKTSEYDKWLEEQWGTYKDRYIDKKVDIKEKSQTTKAKEEKLKVEDDVFKILKGEKKASDLAKEKPKKEEQFNEELNEDLGLDDEELEEKQEECNNYMGILKKSKNGSPEQKQVVEKILNDELWSDPKKQGPGYISLHPFYKKKASGKLINGKIDNNNCTIMLPAGNGSIVIKDGKITYTNGPKK